MRALCMNGLCEDVYGGKVCLGACVCMDAFCEDVQVVCVFVCVCV